MAKTWSETLLPEAYFFQEGPGIRKWQFTSSGIKLLNVANIEKSGQLNLAKTDRHLSVDEVESRYKHFLVDEGDLVIASSGISFDHDGLLRTRGAFVEAKHLPLCLNTSTIRFKAIEGVSDLSFLRHWIDSREFRQQITQRVTGSAQQNFGPSHLKELRIKLPPLTEQKRIAEILDRAEALRSQRHAALALLDELTQSIFLDMFGDPVTNPMGWAITTIGEHSTKIGSGATPRGGNDSYKAHGISLIRSLNVRDGQLSKRDLAFIDNEQAKKLDNVIVEKGDVLLNITGASVARVCRAPRDILPARVNQHVCIIRPSGMLNSCFLESQLLTPQVKCKLLSVAEAGATRQAITKSQVEDFRIVIPPRHVQDEFERRATKAAEDRDLFAATTNSLDQLFASLQHRAFSGEL